jgi:hypothetical protein
MGVSQKPIAYNSGVVNGPLQGPSKVGCLLFAQWKKITAIFAGAVAPAARAVKFDVEALVGNKKVALEEWAIVNLGSVLLAGKPVALR